MEPPSRYVLLRHPILRTNVEAFKPSHDSLAQDPCLASVQEDGLHNHLIELCTSPWQCVLPTQHLSYPCPHPLRLAKQTLHSLDVIVLLQEQAGGSEVQSKMIFMGHQISSCHVPVVRSFFILWKMLLSSKNLPYDHLPKYTYIIFCYPKK